MVYSTTPVNIALTRSNTIDMDTLEDLILMTYSTEDTYTQQHIRVFSQSVLVDCYHLILNLTVKKESGFGKYNLSLTNSIGNMKHVFEITPEGLFAFEPFKHLMRYCTLTFANFHVYIVYNIFSLNISSIYFTMRVPVCRAKGNFVSGLSGPLIWLTVKSQLSLRKHKLFFLTFCRTFYLEICK